MRGLHLSGGVGVHQAGPGHASSLSVSQRHAGAASLPYLLTLHFPTSQTYWAHPSFPLVLHYSLPPRLMPGPGTAAQICVIIHPSKMEKLFPELGDMTGAGIAREL